MSTKEKSPETALQPSETEIMAARLAAIVASSDDAIISKTLDGIITSWNAGAERIFGYKPDEIVGRHITTIIPPSLHDEEKDIIAKLRAGERIEHFETTRAGKDGRLIELSITVSPMRDSAGRIIGASKVARDIGERRRADEASARLAAIVASSDDAIISKTLQGFITSWNAGAERIFGYTAVEMIGEHITKLIPRELHHEEDRIIAQLNRGERIEHFETVRVAKDGTRIDISITVSPMRDRTGAIIGASKVARDISDRKRAEEMQRLLIDELNHRIKNTLATVQAIASQTLRRAPNPEHFVAGFNGRIKALARAHGLLTGSSFQGADILDLVRDQLLLGGEEDHRMSWSGPSVLLDGQAALHLALVLHELGTNARKHGALFSPNGRVAVRWHVQSNGSRCLNLDWREAGGPPVAAPSARGFGSVLIEQSLQAHGGEVSVDYAKSGVICEIKLPLPELSHSVGPLVRRADADRSQHQRIDLGSKRILIVEDEPLIGMVLTDYLVEAGCKVIGPAPTNEKATTLIADTAIDAALVDGNLAGRPVDEIAQALSARNIPFAFVTGYDRSALPAGFDAAPIVEKPFTQEQIVTTLERLFSASSSRAGVRIAPS